MEQLTDLIQNITPLYNLYKQNSISIKGKEAVKIMWEIGGHIKNYIELNNLPPHNLFRQIYGKSEGKINIEQKSYISREFQSRCYRIRNIFDNIELIESQLNGLNEFSSFREAMPFFDNPLYSLNKSEFKTLLELLNSNLSSTEIIKKLDSWKKSLNPISNPRTQKLNDLDNEKEVFISFYNLVFRSMKIADYEGAIKNIGINDPDFLKILSKNVSSIAQEGVLRHEMKEYVSEIDITNSFIATLTNLLKKNDEKERRRFRRIIPPERIIRLSEMLYSMVSEAQYLKRRI